MTLDECPAVAATLVDMEPKGEGIPLGKPEPEKVGSEDMGRV
jgi:hypothetical protein